MADEKTFPTDEACALALLIREMTQTLQMDLTVDTETMLRNGVDDLVSRLAELGADWQRAQMKTAPPSGSTADGPGTAIPPEVPQSIDAVETLTETPISPNTSSMPDTVPNPSTIESVTP